MKRLSFVLVALLSLVLGINAQENLTGDMYNLTKIRSGVRNHRVSSYDRSGNNRDHLKEIKPGDTRVLAEIEGAGIINHIWVTIAPGPGELSRNDIILRM